MGGVVRLLTNHPKYMLVKNCFVKRSPKLSFSMNLFENKANMPLLKFCPELKLIYLHR